MRIELNACYRSVQNLLFAVGYTKIQILLHAYFTCRCEVGLHIKETAQAEEVRE